MAESTKTERAHRYSLEQFSLRVPEIEPSFAGYLAQFEATRPAERTIAANRAIASPAYLQAELCFPPTCSAHSSSLSCRPAAVQASSTSLLGSNGHSRAVPS